MTTHGAGYCDEKDMMINGEKAEQENLRRPKNWFHQLSQQKQDLCDGDDHDLVVDIYIG